MPAPSNPALLWKRPACPPFPAALPQLFFFFENLVGIVLKFQPKNRQPLIRIWAAHDGRHLKISIADNGLGLAPEFHKKIFKVFRRLHSREEYEGTGMCLAICKKIHGKTQRKNDRGKCPWGGSHFCLLVSVIDFHSACIFLVKAGFPYKQRPVKCIALHNSFRLLMGRKISRKLSFRWVIILRTISGRKVELRPANQFINLQQTFRMRRVLLFGGLAMWLLSCSNNSDSTGTNMDTATTTTTTTTPGGASGTTATGVDTGMGTGTGTGTGTTNGNTGANGQGTGTGTGTGSDTTRR